MPENQSLIERGYPTKNYLMQLTGSSSAYKQLIESLHHGIDTLIKDRKNNEEWLKGLQKILNFEEFAGFTASVYKSLEKNEDDFKQYVSINNHDKIIAKYVAIGRNWIDSKKRNVEVVLEKTHTRLNPFNRETLNDRISLINNTNGEEMIQSLKDVNVYKYFFEKKYNTTDENEKSEKIIPMWFQPSYPKMNVMASNYAKETLRLLKLNFNFDYIDLQEPRDVLNLRVNYGDSRSVKKMNQDLQESWLD